MGVKKCLIYKQMAVLEVVTYFKGT